MIRACASLPHIPAAPFSDMTSRLVDALWPGGPLYMSFKLGERERVAEGWLFVDRTDATLREALRLIPVCISEIWVSAAVRPGREAKRWVNAIAVKL